MSQLLGKELTEMLLKRLNGQDVEAYEGKIIPIFTLDESGWPHPALLSYYEVVAKNSTTLDIALWKNSSTARNLRQTSKITFLITDKGVNYYLERQCQRVADRDAGHPAAVPISHYRRATCWKTKSPTPRSPAA